jgi:hypothetical protein
MRYAWLCCLLFTAVACGGSSDDDDDNGASGGGVPLEDLPLTLGKASCGKTFECCSDEEIAMNPFLGEDQASCEVTLAAFTSLLVPAIQDAVAGERARYDGAALQGCVNALADVSCAEARSGGGDVTAGEDCGEFLIPLVALGGTCEQSFECINGWCDTLAGSLCSPLKADAATCEDDEECQSGYCDLFAGCGTEPVSEEGNLCQ